MPWKETRVLEERMKFVVARLRDEYPMTELCEAYGISRKTGYKWLERYEAVGVTGLQDQSRAPKEQAQRTDPTLAARAIELRRAHPRWGPRKLRAILVRDDPRQAWPAASTLGTLFARQGLVTPRRRRRPAAATPTALTVATEPNALWAADFKGWFRTADGQRCDPLTLSDLYSRYLLRCETVAATTTAAVWPVFDSAFREYGLPQAIRTDNGPPFASTGLGGLSRLAVRWIRLGIRPERITPGAPQENGCHERMHRTLAAEVTRPPRRTRVAQQRAFRRFRQEFNEERPHEALQQRVPAALYAAAGRPYPRRLPAVEYPAHVEVRRVRQAGEIKWRGQFVYLCQALIGEPVGLEPLSDRHWRVSFATYPLALFDETTGLLVPYRHQRPVPEAS